MPTTDSSFMKRKTWQTKPGCEERREVLLPESPPREERPREQPAEGQEGASGSLWFWTPCVRLSVVGPPVSIPSSVHCGFGCFSGCMLHFNKTLGVVATRYESYGIYFFSLLAVFSTSGSSSDITSMTLQIASINSGHFQGVFDTL